MARLTGVVRAFRRGATAMAAPNPIVILLWIEILRLRELKRLRHRITVADRRRRRA